MRAALLRSTLFAVVFGFAVLGLPLFAFGWFAGLLTTGGSPPSNLALPVASAVVLLVVAGVGIAVFVRREAERLTEPLTALAEQAERLGAGDARVERRHSGIPEIDQVSDVLARSSGRLLSTLTSERQFASDASHQLRTPLTALLMRVEEIALTDDLGVVRDEAAIAIEQVERLTRTVDALLSRTRHTRETPQGVAVDHVLAAQLRLWQPSFEASQRTINVAGERGLGVVATEVTLSQILATLIENSLAHGAGVTTIEARRSGPSVVVEIGDEGPGVPAELAPYVFDRGRSTKGSGLGLGVARDLAEGYGGRLELVRAHPVRFALFMSADEP